MSRRARLAPLPLAAALLATGLGTTAPTTAHAGTPTPQPTALEKADAVISRSAATQGMVLLENSNNTLPISKAGNIAVFGVGSYQTVKGGTGSGNVYNRGNVSVRDGIAAAGYRITTSSAYYDAMKKAYDDKYAAYNSMTFAPAIDYSSVEQPLTPTTVKPTAPTATAIYVIARNSGEGADRSSGKGDFQLTDTERANIALIGKTYRKVIVVLNTGGIMDTSFFSQINGREKDPYGGRALDSLLLMSQAGEESGNALVQVLNGTVAPSGHLTDTWASSYGYYPASTTFAKADGNSLTEHYSEGIYVGYRYFDSFYKKLNAKAPASVVNYPFGYGLTYTTFRTRAVSVKATMDTVTVTARVTNTGRLPGRQVVQVYWSAPTTGLDKPYQNLGGYQKTALLKPGQSQVVRITYRTTSMASYDQKSSAWVMDAGRYVVRVGDQSRNTHVAATLNLAHRTVTQKLHSELVDDQRQTKELTSSPKYFYTYPGEAREIARAQRITLDSRRFTATNGASPLEQSVSVPASSAYHDIDGSKVSKVPVYLVKGETNWDGSGHPYQPKTGEVVHYVTRRSNATLYDVRAGRVTMQQFVAGLGIDELADLVEGADRTGSTLTAAGAAGYTTPLYEKQGIPGMTLSDGPAGLRITQKVPTKPVTYQYATAFPVGTLLAQTWDPTVIRTVGHAVGQEMNEFGATMWLAPGMNIHRDPLNGRNFEYYSEDPLLSGESATDMTLGVQSNPGVGVTVKHYVANNQETDRMTTNAVMSERALREIYLRGFQIVVQQAQPMAVMSSYNLVNGTHAIANYDLLTDVLRGEWGFKGLVMSDWTAADHIPSATYAMYAGNDLIEPGNGRDAIVGQVKKLAPTIDVQGLPAYNENLMKKYGFTMRSLKTGSWTLSPTGKDTISTTVDASTDLSKVLSTETVTDEINNVTTTPHAAYPSVDAAYRDVLRLRQLTGFGSLTDDQKNAIQVTNVKHATTDPNSPVVSYTVVLRGSYPAKGYAMRLGDLQRSAMRVLNAAMQSTQFAQLARLQGVKGVTARPYSAQFGNLVVFTAGTTGPVTGR